MKYYFLQLLQVVAVVAQDKGYVDKEDYGNPDIYGLIERPCPEFDRFCIKGFFAKHSYCKIATGPVEDPYFATQLAQYAAVFNGSTTKTDTDVIGLRKGRIQDFYINKATGNLVLALYFESVTLASAREYVNIFRNGKEPVLVSDFVTNEFKKFTVTIVIPNYLNLRLDRAEITGSSEELVGFVVGPAIAASPDPDVQAAVLTLAANIKIVGLENFFTSAPLIGKIYVQRTICDFGIPVNKIGK